MSDTSQRRLNCRSPVVRYLRILTAALIWNHLEGTAHCDVVTEGSVGLAVFCALLFIPLLAHSQDARPGILDWRYGGFLDLSYAVDFNFPENHRWRSKATTPRVNELAPNMALAYVRKNISQVSPWGMEFSVQAGYDTNAWTA